MLKSKIKTVKHKKIELNKQEIINEINENANKDIDAHQLSFDQFSVLDKANLVRYPTKIFILFIFGLLRKDIVIIKRYINMKMSDTILPIESMIETMNI